MPDTTATDPTETAINEVNQLIDIACPQLTSPNKYPNRGAVRNWINAGHPATVIGADMAEALTWIPGSGADPNSASRHYAFEGESSIDPLYDGYYLGHDPKPTQQQVYDRVFAVTPPVTPPVVPPVTPAPPAQTGGPTREEFSWLFNLVTQNHDPRIVALEKAQPQQTPPAAGPGIG